MVPNRYDLARLLDPITLAEFFSDYYEKQALILQRQRSAYYDDLLTLKDVDHILASVDPAVLPFRVVKQGEQLPQPADPDSLVAAYRDGATVVLESLHRIWMPLARFCRCLEEEVGQPFQTNIYLTPPGSQGFAAHYDTHDVLVLQLAGRKHWRLYGSVIDLPLPTQPWIASQMTVGEPKQAFDLVAGDLLYIPRGLGHEALTSDTVSLHITLGIVTHTWRDVLRAALDSIAAQDSLFRASLPPGLLTGRVLPQAFEEHFRRLLERFVDAADPTAELEQMADRFVLSRRPLLEGSWVHLGDADGLTLKSMVRRRPGVIHRLVQSNGHIYLRYHGKDIQFPPHVHEALRFITETESFRVDAMPGELDDAGKLVLARRLVREGFLTARLEDTW